MKKSTIIMILVISMLSAVSFMSIIVNIVLITSKSENIGNNTLQVGYISNIEYSDNPESEYFEEATDIITFDINGELYECRDFAEDMEVGDYVLLMVNTKGTKSVKDDIILDWRSYIDCENGEFAYLPKR